MGKILAIFLVLAMPRAAHAWHRGGHAAVAALAWLELADPGLRAQVTATLEQHPHRALFLDAHRPPDVPADEWRFVQAALWADWVQNPGSEGVTPQAAAAITRKYAQPTWHFINLPVVPPDEATRFDEQALRRAALEAYVGDEGEPRHVLAALDRECRQWTAPTASAEQRAVALSWVLHLVADLHQPLHAATLISASPRFQPWTFLPPQGDEGGNRLAVKARAADADALELHFFWDDLWIGDRPLAEVRDLMSAGRSDPRWKRSALSEQLAQPSPRAWVEESWKLACSAVYRVPAGLLAARALPPRHTAADLHALAAPELPAGYAAQAEDIARGRIFLAGYRLSDLLRARLASPPQSPARRQETTVPRPARSVFPPSPSWKR